VAQACNAIYSGSKDQSGRSWFKASLVNSSQESISKIINYKKGLAE
jgi:hypothetical protein